MKRLWLVMAVSGLSVFPLDAPAAEDTVGNQSHQNSIKETISDRYLRLPVCQGGRSRIGSTHTLVDAMVKDRQGRDIGMVENLIMDTKTEKVLFVVLSLSGSDKMVTVPWNKVQLVRAEGKLRLGGQAVDFQPELNPQLTRRKSPRIAVLWNEAEQLHDSMSDEKSKPERGTTEEEWSDPGDGLTPYSYLPLAEEDENGGQ